MNKYYICQGTKNRITKKKPNIKTEFMKKMTLKFTLVLLISWLMGPIMAQAGGDKVIGKWFNEEKDAKVEIYKEGDKYFGKVIWLQTPNNEQGTPKLDKENPDEKLKTRPVLGLLLLKDFVYDDEEWEDGEIYDPKSGKTYSCYMEFEDDGSLMIKGYIGVKWVGKTTYWTKAD